MDCYHSVRSDGVRAALSDDVGGPGCYREFLTSIKDRMHEAYENMLIRIGGAFASAQSDPNAINRTPQFGPPAVSAA